MIVQADRHLADNDQEANHKKVLRLIEAAGAAGLSRTDLYKKTHSIGEKRDAVLSALIQAGQIAMAEVRDPHQAAGSSTGELCSGE